MIKVECYACGGIGVIRRRQRRWSTYEDRLCHRCKGFGFILVSPTKFSKHKTGKNPRFISLGEYKVFTGLVRVRNIHHVFVPTRGRIPYSVFYKEHRNHS